jgi:glycerol uptake facilitator-like aquaporin
VREGYARPSHFTIFTITFKVAVYALAERADTHSLFHINPYMLAVWLSFNFHWCKVLHRTTIEDKSRINSLTLSSKKITHI